MRRKVLIGVVFIVITAFVLFVPYFAGRSIIENDPVQLYFQGDTAVIFWIEGFVAILKGFGVFLICYLVFLIASEIVIGTKK